jgi:hypothetical protein
MLDEYAAKRTWRLLMESPHLEPSYSAFSQVNLAMGIVIARQGVDSDAALDFLLGKTDHHDGRGLRIVADEVIRTRGRPPSS